MGKHAFWTPTFQRLAKSLIDAFHCYNNIEGPNRIRTIQTAQNNPIL